jgi:hypothetical protein
MIFAVALVALAGPGEGKRQARAGGGGGRGEKQAILDKSMTAVAKFIAGDVGLAADKTDKFVSAYVAAREAALKEFAGKAKSGDKTQLKTAREDSKKAIDAVLDANLTPEQAKKAKEYDLEGFERSIRTLLAANVEDAKLQQAVPVLAKYHKAVAETMAKTQSREIKRQDAAAKESELKASTAKELVPIIGEAAVAQWQGAKTVRGEGGKKAGAPEGGKVGKGGRKGGGPTVPAAPVAPIAP